MEKLEFSTRFTGRIIQALDPRGGTSQRTGNSWKSQSFILEEVGMQYPQKIVFDVFGEDNLGKFNIQVGCDYEVFLSFGTDEYQGRHYPRIRAWNVKALNLPQETYAVPANAPSANADLFAPEGEGDSELPF